VCGLHRTSVYQSVATSIISFCCVLAGQVSLALPCKCTTRPSALFSRAAKTMLPKLRVRSSLHSLATSVLDARGAYADSFLPDRVNASQLLEFAATSSLTVALPVPLEPTHDGVERDSVEGAAMYTLPIHYLSDVLYPLPLWANADEVVGAVGEKCCSCKGLCPGDASVTLPLGALDPTQRAKMLLGEYKSFSQLYCEARPLVPPFSVATFIVKVIKEFFSGDAEDAADDDAQPAVHGVSSTCGCNHQVLASLEERFDDDDVCSSRSVPSSFGFPSGAILSKTVPPRSTLLMGPLVFSPTVCV
jgi:hypothetical protein